MENEDNLIESLREKGVTCTRLKGLEKRELREASEFRKLGFQGLANSQEASAGKLKELRGKVCKLR